MTTPFIPKVAAIHDLSGFGRTSLTVIIPVLSSMGIQVCPLPTAVLSTHTTEFQGFTFHDLTSQMNPILDHWQSLGLKFDAVYSGFLAIPEQVAMVERCIKECLAPGGLAVVDPVLGDNGCLDPTITPELVDSMRHLSTKAHIITPNITEAAFLLKEACPTSIKLAQAVEWAQRLAHTGPNIVVITSVPLPSPQGICNAVLGWDKKQGRCWKIDCRHIPVFYPGTGDTFASVLTGALLQGDCLPLAMDRAVQFVAMGIQATFGHNSPTCHGIALERVLPLLRQPLQSSNYELVAL